MRPVVRVPANVQELTTSRRPISIAVIRSAACTSSLRNHIPPLSELHLLYIFTTGGSEACEGAAGGGIAHHIAVIYGGSADACAGIVGEADAGTELP